jgi:hypothetical protein
VHGNYFLWCASKVATSLRRHFRHQPINQEFAGAGAANGRVDEQILQQAYRSELRRAVMNDIVCHANDLVVLVFRDNVFRDNRMYGS